MKKHGLIAGIYVLFPRSCMYNVSLEPSRSLPAVGQPEFQLSSPSSQGRDGKVDGFGKMAGMRWMVIFLAERRLRTEAQPVFTFDWPKVQASPAKVLTRVALL